MRTLLCLSIVVITLALARPLASQQVGGSAPGPAVEEVPFIFLPSPTVPDAEAASRPIPRLPDGTVDLTGPWVGGGSNVDIEFEGGLKPGELLLLPWARELRDQRNKADEPYTACLPMGVPRVNPYPWKFAMSYTPRGLTHIYVLHETGDAGAHRVIYMDGRKHPVDPLPTWFGHSIGHWEGDTLVVDTVGYNDKFWFDSRGTPHTEQLHTVERYTRINWGRLRHVLLLEDPGAFSRPVTLNFMARLLRADLKTGGGELMEFICLEDNQYGAASGIRPGTGTSVK
ncbi:MAG: hypothetical protein HYY76_12840 [Acidobacteria bacterium]|nr:hypothetical protein [Acidobacteriota bacterium]